MIATRARVARWLLAACFVTAAVVVARPTPKRVVVTDTTIEILDDVRFVGDTIATPSLRTLDAIADTFIGNPSIALVEVQAPSLARAQACVDYLVGQGVAAERLVPAVNDSDRAAFLIVTRSDSQL